MPALALQKCGAQGQQAAREHQVLRVRRRPAHAAMNAADVGHPVPADHHPQAQPALPASWLTRQGHMHPALPARMSQPGTSNKPPPTHPAPSTRSRMEDFNRERQLYSLAISPQFVPMMYFCEVRGWALPPATSPAAHLLLAHPVRSRAVWEISYGLWLITRGFAVRYSPHLSRGRCTAPRP